MTQNFVLHPNDTSRPRVLANLIDFLQKLPETKAWKVEVAQYQKTRTSQQCRYLNGVAYKLLGDATGYDRDDISEYLCGTYWGWKDKPMPGKRIAQVPVRTTTTDEDGKRNVLSRAEFGEFVEFVQRFGAEHGIFIPNPEESTA